MAAEIPDWVPQLSAALAQAGSVEDIDDVRKEFLVGKDEDGQKLVNATCDDFMQMVP